MHTSAPEVCGLKDFNTAPPLLSEPTTPAGLCLENDAVPRCVKEYRCRESAWKDLEQSEHFLSTRL